MLLMMLKPLRYLRSGIRTECSGRRNAGHPTKSPDSKTRASGETRWRVDSPGLSGTWMGFFPWSTPTLPFIDLAVLESEKDNAEKEKEIYDVELFFLLLLFVWRSCTEDSRNDIKCNLMDDGHGFKMLVIIVGRDKSGKAASAS